MLFTNQCFREVLSYRLSQQSISAWPLPDSKQPLSPIGLAVQEFQVIIRAAISYLQWALPAVMQAASGKRLLKTNKLLLVMGVPGSDTCPLGIPKTIWFSHSVSGNSERERHLMPSLKAALHGPAQHGLPASLACLLHIGFLYPSHLPCFLSSKITACGEGEVSWFLLYVVLVPYKLLLYCIFIFLTGFHAFQRKPLIPWFNILSTVQCQYEWFHPGEEIWCPKWLTMQSSTEF